MIISTDILGWRYAHDPTMMHALVYAALLQERDGSISVGKLSKELGLSTQCVRTILKKILESGVATSTATNKSTNLTYTKYISYGKRATNKTTSKAANKIDMDSFVDDVHKVIWQEWIEYRNAMKKKFVSTKSAQANYNKLCTMSTVTTYDAYGHQCEMIDIEMMKAIIENTIANGWQGLVKPKPQDGYKTRTDINDSAAPTAQYHTETERDDFDAEARIRALRERSKIFAEAPED